MDCADLFFVSSAVLRGRAYTRGELATTAATPAERYEHQRMAALYEKAIEDAAARRAVIAHDQRTHFAMADESVVAPAGIRAVGEDRVLTARTL